MQAPGSISHVVRAQPSELILVLACCLGVSLAVHGHQAGNATSDAHRIIDHALLMVAMMLPLSGSSADLAAERSFRDRRWNAVVEHIAGFSAVWLGFGLGAGIVVNGLRSRFSERLVFALLILLAAAWQISDRRRRLLERASRVNVGAATGWRFHRDETLAGSSVSIRCLQGGWASMLAMVATTNVIVMAMVLTANLSESMPGANPFAARRRKRPLGLYLLLGVISVVWLAIDSVRPA